MFTVCVCVLFGQELLKATEELQDKKVDKVTVQTESVSGSV